MINEGYDLLTSLEQCKIPLVARHPDVKKPGKKDGIIVGLDADGEAARIEFRTKDAISSLWTTSEGNHNSFPVLKLQRPLWVVGRDHSLRKEIYESRNDELKKRGLLVRQSLELNVTQNEHKWWDRLCRRVSQLQPFFDTMERRYGALAALSEYFLKIVDVEVFLKGLLRLLKAHSSLIPYSLMENILIGNRWHEEKREFRAEVPVVLDISGWEEYEVRVASPDMEPFVSKCLFAMSSSSDDPDNGETSIQRTGISALSGHMLPLENRKFPNPKLPVIGNAYLFSVNDQTPCQSRYGRSSTDIFPAGKSEANAIQDSLIWVTDEERREKTWYPVPGTRDGEWDLLIAYLSEKPDLDLNKARLLGGISGMDELTFEATARPIVDAYRGRHVLKPSDKIRFFVIRQADPGRKQIVVDRSCSVKDIVEAAEAWQEGAKNSPPFEIDFIAKKGANSRTLSPYCPFPADLLRVTQKQWLRAGEGSAKVPGMSHASVYEIFLDLRRKTTREVQLLLGMVLRRTQPLLIGLVGSMRRKAIDRYNNESRIALLIAISTISVCLYKLGIGKEHYMGDTYFNIGRFLSLVDTLHMEYCRNVRNGDIPPQLLGNSQLRLALDNPAAAFAQLSKRIGVYQAWTKKEQTERVKLARWAVGEIGRVSLNVAEKGLPSRTDDAGKAQILLGYLARSDSKETGDA